MALENIKKLKSGKGEKKEPGYGVVMEIQTTKKLDNGGVEVIGIVQSNSPLAEKGQIVRVVGDDKMVHNLSKGGARFHDEDASKGQVILMERCTNGIPGADGVKTLNTSWVTTIYAPNKHEPGSRGFVEGLASAPSFRIPNVNPAAGEPKSFYVSLNTDGASRRKKDADGKWTNDPYDREFLRGKLAEAQAAGKNVTLQVKVFDAANAVPVATGEQLSDVIKSLAARDESGGCVIRAFGEKMVLMRSIERFGIEKIGEEYVSAPQKTIDYLLEKGVFRGYGNDDVFADVANDPSSVMEVIPTRTIRFGTGQNSSGEKMINSYLDGAAGKDNPHTWVFGDKVNNLTKVILPVLKGDSGDFAVNLVREEPGYVHLRDLQTPNRVPSAAHAADAALDPEDGLDPDDGFEDLTLDAAMAADDSARTPAAASPGM